MEETGAFMAVTFIMKPGSSYWRCYTVMAVVLANSGLNGQTIPPYGPLDAVRMASSTSRFAAAIA